MNGNGNRWLHLARWNKQDEFYTTFGDVESELAHYERSFRGKAVYCNCDNPYESSFFRYFVLNFNGLGLRRLVATCYDGTPGSGEQLLLFDDGQSRTAFMATVTTVPDGIRDDFDVDWLAGLDGNSIRLCEGNGDFMSEECVSILRESDIVVTNPPFSLFRQFVSLLRRNGKGFLILGNQNAITYKEVFSMLKDGEMWLGHENGNMEFRVPDDYEERSTRSWTDCDGQKWRSLGNVCWFTNLDCSRRHEWIPLTAEYDAQRYRKYDNLDAIDVGETSLIPKDYDGMMGVPITFLNRHCQEQFEIVGFRKGIDGKDLSVDGKSTYFRVVIRRRHG